jgi:HPt (histidine-containing phosphotransfer) domain-containing protein
VGKLLATFFDDLSARARSLDEALTQGNTERIAQIAHMIVGSGAMFGFPQLGEAARAVEHAARLKADNVSSLTTELLSLCRRIEAGRSKSRSAA